MGRVNTWWRHQMETFSALLAICAGNSPVPGEFPTQRPVTRSFDVFFDVRPNKQLSKQSWGWWFETLSSSLWRHRNEYNQAIRAYCVIAIVAKNLTDIKDRVMKYIKWFSNLVVLLRVNTLTPELNDRCHGSLFPLWLHAMKTLSTLPALCEGNPPVTRGFPSQSDGNADVFFDVSLNK